MLIKFAVKNFRGFAERIEWDLSHPSNYEFNKYAIKDGIMVLYMVLMALESLILLCLSLILSII